MFAHPAKYFIRFLLLIELEKVSLDTLNEKLASFGFSNISKEYLDFERGNFPKSPLNFAPWDRRHKPSRKHLLDLGIFSLTHPDVHVSEMQEFILGRPRVREIVEKLAFSRLTPREISKNLSELGYRITETAISHFIHYFWNMEKMSLSDWTTYLEEDKRTFPEFGEYTAALKSGPSTTLFRLGLSSQVEISTIFQDLLGSWNQELQVVKSWPTSPKKISAMATITRGVSKVDERMKESDASMLDVLKKFEKFKIKKPSGGFASLSELAPNGSVSRDRKGDIINEEADKSKRPDT